MQRVASLAFALLNALAIVAPAQAQQYPAQTIRILVGFGPGSSADILARLVAKHAEVKLGKPVVVENRPGNGSMIAADQVAKAPRDGYTLLMGTVAQTLVPVRRKMEFRADRELAPVSLLAIVPILLVAHPSLGVKNAQELLALAKSKPETLTFGTSGAGTAAHLAAELFNITAGTKIVVAHYQGGSTAVLPDLLAGRINLAFNVAATLAPHVEKGSLVALGLAQPARTKTLPAVPTMAEQGMPGFDAGVWIGLFAPPGTPASILDLLAATATEAVRDASAVNMLDAQGIDPLGGTPGELATFVAKDIDKWAKVVAGAGLYE